MAIKFCKKAIKFLEKANPEDVENIREQINQVVVAIEELGIIPLTQLRYSKYERRLGEILQTAYR